MSIGRYWLATGLLALAACGNAPVAPTGSGHLTVEEAPAPIRNIPPPVRNTIALPKPKATPQVETYSVVVHNVRAQELLFALARDARLNVDIHPGINGVVTLNAIDQTLQQILTRIARQIDMRWELDGPNLAVMADTPFLRSYAIDYVNMSRDASGSVSISTQIGSTTSTATGAASATTSTGSNISTTKVDNIARNRFWESLERNVKDILHETDKILPEGSSDTLIEHSDAQTTTGTGAQAGGRKGPQAGIAGSPNPAAMQHQGTTVVKRATFREAASVIVNPESGIVVVRATSRQHEKIQEFLDLVVGSAKRQVLIEATIAEVSLSDQFQQGINWQSLRSLRSSGSNSAGFQGGLKPTGTPVPDPMAATNVGNAFLLNYVAPGLGISSTISLLRTFGNVRVLSSPKISVLNNQTALLKVVNNVVYFEIKADTTTSSTGLATTNVTTTPRSVSVGLVMTVTPQISESDIVTLNVRPSISRVKGTKKDPNPNIPAGLTNEVPEIETREMESILRLSNGEIAVMGGLMQDGIDNTTHAIPGLGQIPVIGNFFKQRNETATKTELVIFLRPVVIRDPSVAGDFAAYRDKLPGREFFAGNPPDPDRPMAGEPAR
ncbi:MAG: pilus (MSHA type) biogenesis protein MshL [Sterolibacteriaceae bacterium MAG5]|nr:pilus (MSHA type) biogenesis protein MshL [Candidatus Nitricoxidireducens bremensis]